ncbi:right-handed parallel beta-helix repeat-containing protein [Candidatus Omnitrophota bacterium]
MISTKTLRKFFITSVIRFARFLFLIAIFCAVSCTSKTDSSIAFYVSPSGNDDWSGTLLEPNSSADDGPFATFERARDAIRALKNTELYHKKGVTVYLRGSTYQIDETFNLTEEDSGTDDSPIIWRSYPGEKVIFSGGRQVNSFGKITDQSVLKRLDKSYHDSILKADLTALDISDFGDVNPRSGHRLEVFFREKFMTVARYPNEGWLKIADVPQTGEKRINEGLDRDKSAVPRGRHYGRFTYSEDRPDKWADSNDIWVHGYWTWDWSDQHLNVAQFDKEKRDIYPKEPHHGYGYTKNQRFYFLNILEELDAPGEWYLDKSEGVLYFWPPSLVEKGDVIVSVLEDPMISLDGVSNVTISDLTFEGSRAGAINSKDGSRITIAGCTFRNLGNTAVVIDGGKGSGVLSCDIYDVAGGGVRLQGGDRKTLTSAGHYAVNNHIHDFGIRIKTYTPAVEITGVGNRAAHNLIHDAPHTGIFLSTSRLGNDHVIEYNELHSLAKETGDVGAIYLCARDFTMRGNIIRYNYIHHLFGPGLHGVMAIYLDDFTSGTEVYGNICYKASRAVLLGGGRNNTIENNIFIECDPSVHVDARGLGWARYYFEKNNRFLDLMEAVNYTEPPYSERYPELLTLQKDDPAVPKYNKIVRNISTGGRWLDLYDGMDYEIVAVKNNVVADKVLSKWRKKGDDEFTTYSYGEQEIMEILEKNDNVVIDSDPGFADPQSHNFRLNENSHAYKLGFKDIPFEKIGLYVDEYRKKIPERK